MKKLITGAVALILLSGCTASKPGAFERVDEDSDANTVQYRFDPAKVNRDAMDIDLAKYCIRKGFDKVEALPEQESYIPGLKKVWFQCNYAVKS